jgi:hypothetical protein
VTNETQESTAGLTRADLVITHALREDPRLDIVEAIGAALTTLYPNPDSETPELTQAELQAIADALPAAVSDFRNRVGRSASVTGGAKDLVAGTSQLEPAFRIVITDKLARSTLRARHQINIARTVEFSSEPLAVLPDPAAAVPDEDAGESLSAVSFGEACLQHDVDFRVLENSSQQIPYAVKKIEKSISLPELAELLRRPGQASKVVEICNGLWRSGEQFVFITLLAAAQAGRITIDPANEPQFRIFGIRALLAMNAVESAYQEATALAADAEAVEALPVGERKRLGTLVARSAVRSGRADQVADEYTELFVTAPTPDVFRILLGIACVRDRPLALGMCHTALNGAYELDWKDWTFIAELLREYEHPELCLAIAQGLITDESPPADAYLLMANVGLAMGNEVMWRTSMRQYFEAQSLPVRYEPHELRPFGFVSDIEPLTEPNELVTIVMTTYNAAATLALSVASIQAQTCSNWELIIVDDVSSDDTREVIERLANEDARVSYIFKTENQGTYLAKNEGMKIANGEFITFHDSDDWMHPMRLERHLQEMTSGAACTTSRWIRMDSSGMAVVRRGGPFIHVNPASTFFRRSAIDAVGYFEGVRTGADSEMLARLRATFGASSVRALDDCLALGLHHDESLTRSGAAAFDEYRHSPVRVAYWESWLRWHVIQSADGHSLFNPGTTELPFHVPEGIRP